MVRGIGSLKQKKKYTGLMKNKDYITEAMVQGGKAIGDIVKLKENEKRNEMGKNAKKR